jgi:hypothetical protein
MFTRGCSLKGQERRKNDIWIARQVNHDSMGRFCCYRCSTLINYNKYFCTGLFFDSIEWLNWFLFRFVFIFNYLQVNYFSFLDVLGLGIHHFWWKEYFSRTPGSYRYNFGTCGNRICTTNWFTPSPPSGRNAKKSIWVRRNKPKIYSKRLGNQEIAVSWKLVVWASRVSWCQKKLEHMCGTGGPGSMYVFTAANVRFGGTSSMIIWDLHWRVGHPYTQKQTKTYN